jgi:hypothetical protein
MLRRCEVCSKLDSGTASKRKVRRVLVEDRIVALCDKHAAELQMSGGRGLDELRALFTENDGRRSLVSRRSPLDRRVFPARPEGRRRSGGRRTDDPPST